MTNQPKDISVIYTTRGFEGLLGLLSTRLADPVDSYWNGSHTWFSALDNTELEWRLHPVKDFTMPEASRPEELFELALEGEVDPEHYWEGLEIYSFDETSATPQDLAEYVSAILERRPDAQGYVDHESIAQEYERNNGNVSIIQLLMSQMNA